MNVGYLHGQKGSTHRFSHGPSWRPHSPSQTLPLSLPDQKVGQGSAQGPGSTSFPTALGGTTEPEHAHLALKI